MSFRDLKSKFDYHGEELAKLAKADPYKYLFLMCLFEINGNLDTIALTSRATVENQGVMLAKMAPIVEFIESQKKWINDSQQGPPAILPDFMINGEIKKNAANKKTKK
jgi:hypothetical protein